MAAPATQQPPSADSRHLSKSGGCSGDAGGGAPATGRLTFDWQAGPAGYEVAPGVHIPADRLRTWECPNCHVKHHGTLGQIVDQMVVMLHTAPGQPRSVFHGCTACEAPAPRPAQGRALMALTHQMVPPRRGFDLRPDDGGPLFSATLKERADISFDLKAALAGPPSRHLAWAEQLDQARASTMNPDGTFNFRPITGPGVPTVDQEVNPLIPCQVCGTHLRHGDTRLQQVLDEAGELVFQGCQSCLVARLRQKEEVAALRATLRRLRVLLLDIQDIRGWADPHALLERIRAEVARLSPKGG